MAFGRYFFSRLRIHRGFICPRLFISEGRENQLKPLKFLFISALIVFFLPNLQAENQNTAFKPAWWCPGAHLQTIYAGLFREKPDLPLKRERVWLPDGDFLDLDWLDGGKNTPLVVVLHGLDGSAHVSYVLTLLEEFKKLNWQAVAMNARGSVEMNQLLKTTHAGKSEDLDFAIQHIISLKKSDRIYLVGYSLGGNVVLKWLGEKGREVPGEISRAVVVSVPYNLEKAADNLDQGFNREVYTRSMLKDLKVRAVEKAKKFPNEINVETVKKARTFHVYDHEITAKLNGFQDEHDYWRQSSSVNYLDKIRVPVLLIHAANDPFLPKKDLPIDEIARLPNLKLELTSDGGHLGFVSGNIPFHSEKWLESRILSFFRDDN